MFRVELALTKHRILRTAGLWALFQSKFCSRVCCRG